MKSKYLIMWCVRYQTWCVTKRKYVDGYPDYVHPVGSVLFAGGSVKWYHENRPIRSLIKKIFKFLK